MKRAKPKAKKAPKKSAPKKRAKKSATSRVVKPPRNRLSKTERESLARSERERRSEARRVNKHKRRQRERRASLRETERARPTGPRGERDALIAVLESLTPPGASLDIVAPEGGRSGREMWIVVGRIDFDPALTYAELASLLYRWEGDPIAELRIGMDRVSQMRSVFRDPKWRGKAGNTFLSEAGPWLFLLGALRAEVESLAQRYNATTVPTIYIYFSAEHQTMFEVGR